MLNIVNTDTKYSAHCKKLVNTYIEQIVTPDVRYLLELAFSKVSEDFWHEAASSTGKYHPLYACGEAGLARHTIAAVHFLERWFIAYNCTPYVKDIMLAALLLHDTCKRGIHFEDRWTLFEHPILVRELIDSQQLTPNQRNMWFSICNMIACHMGRWNTPSQKDLEKNMERIVLAFSNYRGTLIQYDSPQFMNLISLPVPKSFEEQIVANCDFCAADKECMLTIFDQDKEAWANVTR